MIGEHLCVRVCVCKKPSHDTFTSGNSAEAAILLFYESMYIRIYMYMCIQKKK